MDKNQEQPNYRQILLLIALLAAAAASYKLIAPFLSPILVAFILGVIFYPLHERLLLLMGNRANLAAIASSTLLTFIILIPLLFLVIAIVQQGITFAANFTQWINDGGPEQMFKQGWLLSITSQLRELMPAETFESQNIKQQLGQSATTIGKNLVDIGSSLLGNITGLIVDFTLTLFVFFFVVRDYKSMMWHIRHALPLSRSQEDALLKEIQQVSKSALLGSFLTAVCQGIAGGFIFWLAGLPGLFWGAMMAFASLIPVVGTALIWLPASVYLYATGDTTWAIIVLVWSIVVVGSIDNFLRPIFMQGGSSLNTLMVFFALLGGLQVFGLSGLLFGPLVFAITLVLYRIYEQEFSQFLSYQDRH